MTQKFVELSFREKSFLFFSTGFFSGYFPFASGTFASFIAIIIYLIIPGFENPLINFVIVFIFFLIGIFTSGYAEKQYGFDPPEVVIDEIVGMWMTMLFVPKTFLLSAIGFSLFRFFDIVKPYPAKQSQELKGGLGIMLDDIIAGLYSLVTLHLILVIFPEIKSL